MNSVVLIALCFVAVTVVQVNGQHWPCGSDTACENNPNVQCTSPMEPYCHDHECHCHDPLECTLNQHCYARCGPNATCDNGHCHGDCEHH